MAVNLGDKFELENTMPTVANKSEWMPHVTVRAVRLRTLAVQWPWVPSIGKICSPSTLRVTSPKMENAKILEWDWKPQTNHSFGDVTSTVDGLQIFTYDGQWWPLGSDGSFACPTNSDTGHNFIMVISEDPWHSHLLPNVWQWSCQYLFNDLGL